MSNFSASNSIRSPMFSSHSTSPNLIPSSFSNLNDHYSRSRDAFFSSSARDRFKNIPCGTPSRSIPSRGDESSGVRTQRRGKDEIFPLNVSLEELYNGTSKRFNVWRNVLCPICMGTCNACGGYGMIVTNFYSDNHTIYQKQEPCTYCDCTGIKQGECPECNGERVVQENKVLRVVVEKGMRHGQKITFPGEADEAPGTVTGDMVFVLEEEEHPTFKRMGDDLLVEHRLAPTEAQSGFRYILTHLDGRQLLIKSKPGEVIKHAQSKAINNDGMPIYQNSSEKGKLYIQFKVDLQECSTPEPTDMEIDMCEEPTLHDVNMEKEMRRKQQQPQCLVM